MGPRGSDRRRRSANVRSVKTARNRRIYLAISIGGNLAFEIASVAIAWHVFTLHHRPLDLGLVGLTLFVPSFVFALPAGVVADRRNRLRLATFCGIVEAAAVFGLVAAVVAHVTALPAYLGILALIGTTRAFDTPAIRSILPSIIEAGEYVKTQAAFASLREFVRIGGPALGGVLVAFSVPLALATAGTLIFFSALGFGALRMTHAARPTAPPTISDAFGGLRFIASRPIVASAISLDLFAVLFGGATALLPAFADGIFHVGAQGLGAMRAAPAVGAALVAATIARRPIERRVGPTLLATVAIFGLATIAFAFARDFVLALLLLAIVGGSDMVSVVIRSGLVQLATPDGMRGRVNAVENVFIGASNELGEFESGTLAAFVGVVPAVAIGGIGTLAIIALWCAFVPALRNADRFLEVTQAEAGAG